MLAYYDLLLSKKENELIVENINEESQKELDKRLLEYVHALDLYTQGKVIEYARDLSKVREYQKKED